MIFCPLCLGGSAALVLPGSGHPLLVQGQSIAPVAGPSILPAHSAAEEKEVEAEMGPAVTIMKPILRFLQLLCENHNQDLQVRLCSEPGARLFLYLHLEVVM